MKEKVDYDLEAEVKQGFNGSLQEDRKVHAREHRRVVCKYDISLAEREHRIMRSWDTGMEGLACQKGLMRG